jgi:hypothetical protein
MNNEVEIEGKGYINYNNGWYKKGNIFFYQSDWQIPAKTELSKLEEQLKVKEEKRFVQYVFFPWASLVDYLNTNNQEKAKKLINALTNHPPKTCINVITYCQHIYAMTLIDFFKKLRITEIYWAHKVKSVNEIDGIKIKPLQLYPVMFEKYKNLYTKNNKSKRPYLYSFIGSHQDSCYISDIRKAIFKLERKPFNQIIRRANWHFDADVYKKQMFGITESQAEKEVKIREEIEYVVCLTNSVFSLCPSGSGPNSIRIWESLSFGCIPVVFSSNLHLPEAYSNRVIQLNEDSFSLNNFIFKLENNTIDSVLKYYGVEIE